MIFTSRLDNITSFLVCLFPDIVIERDANGFLKQRRWDLSTSLRLRKAERQQPRNSSPNTPSLKIHRRSASMQTQTSIPEWEPKIRSLILHLGGAQPKFRHRSQGAGKSYDRMEDRQSHRNLQEALRYLRHDWLERDLWVDAVCLYLDRYRTKYRGNLRLGSLFSKGFRFTYLV